MQSRYDAVIIGAGVIGCATALELKYTRRSLNVGFYSRNREINTDSGFSAIG